MEATKDQVDHILIGGSGFIARHLRQLLNDKNILILDINKPEQLEPKEQYLYVDIRKPFDSDKLIDGYHIDKSTTLHHLAAVHFDFQEKFMETNLNGTKNVINAFDSIRRWIFYSSVATYGDSLKIRTEKSEQLPTNEYGLSKLRMEELIRDLEKSGKLNGKKVIVRPGVVYGEYNFGNVFNLMNLSQKFIPIGLSSNPVKSMAYVKNLVSSTLYSIDNINEEEIFIYNYVDYDQLGTKDLLVNISRAIKKPKITIPFRLAMGIAWFVSAPFRLVGRDFIVNPMRVKKFSQPTHFLADKIRQLGWEQPIQPNEAISTTLKWIRSVDIETLRRNWKNSLKDL